MRGGSCSPRLSAQPLTQTPRRASRRHVRSPLTQTILLGANSQVLGKASAFAIQNAFTPSGITEGRSSRANQSPLVGSSGHSFSRATFGGPGCAARKLQLSRDSPESARPRRKVTSQKGRVSTLAPIF